MKSPDDIKRQDLVILCILTLLALGTRGYGIWSWSLIGDEYYTITYAAERATSFINPAYYALVLGSTHLFGVTEWSARLPAVILGVLSVPVFYVTCRSLFDRRTAFIGSILIIASGWHLYHSQLSRFYSGVFLFGMLSFFLYYSALQKGSYRLLAGALVANVAGILFHVTSVLVPTACALYSAFILLRKRTDVSDQSKRVAAAHLKITSAVGLLSLPFFIYIVNRWQFEGGASGSVLSLHFLLQLVSDVDIALAISSLLGLLFLLQKHFSKGVFFALGIGVPLLALFLGSILTPPVRPKYMFYAFPLIITLSAFLCAEASRALSSYRLGNLVVPLLVITGMMPSFVSYYTGKSSLDVRDAIEVIEQRYKPGDTIVAFSHSYQYFLQDFPPEALHILGGKKIWRQALTSCEEEHQRTWILLDTYRNNPLEQAFESWLQDHASLVWRAYEKRYDYAMMGYEIYLVPQPYTPEDCGSE